MSEQSTGSDSIELTLDVFPAELEPRYKGEIIQSVLLVNPCDGWHAAFAHFDPSDNEFMGMFDFTGEEQYHPKEFYCAWAALRETETFNIVEKLESK